jgi:hypothetical protein
VNRDYHDVSIYIAMPLPGVGYDPIKYCPTSLRSFLIYCNVVHIGVLDVCVLIVFHVSDT